MRDGRHFDRIKARLFVIATHRRESRGFACDARSRRMVRMRIVPMSCEDYFRPVSADKTDDRRTRFLGEPHMAIRLREIQASVELESVRRVQRLFNGSTCGLDPLHAFAGSLVRSCARRSALALAFLVAGPPPGLTGAATAAAGAARAARGGALARCRLDRLRLRGLSGARDEVLLTATAQNLKRIVKLLGRAPSSFAAACPA